jgi:hypothetical protein
VKNQAGSLATVHSVEGYELHHFVAIAQQHTFSYSKAALGIERCCVVVCDKNSIRKLIFMSTYLWDIRKTYTFLVGNTENKTPLRRF